MLTKFYLGRFKFIYGANLFILVAFGWLQFILIHLGCFELI